MTKKLVRPKQKKKPCARSPIKVADWIIFIEAIDDKTLLKIWDDEYMLEPALIKNGGCSASIGTYKLHFSLSPEDLIE